MVTKLEPFLLRLITASPKFDNTVVRRVRSGIKTEVGVTVKLDRAITAGEGIPKLVLGIGGRIGEAVSTEGQQYPVQLG